MQAAFDRSAEDVGNVVALEHVNVRIPDQQIATVFYVTGLGLTRDPYIMTGIDNMWINVGRSQFHLPTGKAQVLRGRTGIVLPDREALLRRLARVRQPLAETLFDFREHNSFVDVTSPWGNRIRCHAPEPRFGRIRLGMPYVEFDVPRSTAEGIARFYREIVDPASGKALFTIEHEVRSSRHPLYNRPLVNRNPEQTNTNYAPGHDGAAWSMAHQD